MSQNIEVGVKITADSKGLSSESRAAADALKNLGETAKSVNAESAAAAERFTASLKRQADTLGMTASQVRAYDAAQLNLSNAQKESVEASNRSITAYENQQAALDDLKTRAIAAGVAIGTALVAGMKQSITLAAEAEQSHLRLAAVLRGTGHAAGLTKADLDEMAEGMKEKLGIDDDALRDSMAVLLTFRNVSRDSFGEALEVSADLAAVMQTDLKSAVLQLGKALENPDEGLTALKRSGVSFSETQKDMIKDMVETGKQAEAITLILKTMKEQGLDGVAESMNQGITKATRDAGMAWDDLLKTIGGTEAVKGTVDAVLGSWTQYLSDMRQVIESGDWLDRLAFFTIGLKTPSMIAKSGAAAAAEDPQARAMADEGLARQKAAQEAEIAAIAKKKADEAAAKAAEEASRRAIAAARAREEAERRAYQQSVDSANRTIAALKMETDQIGLNTVQKRMMVAATEAAKAPTRELAEEIMASAQAWALATQRQEEMVAAEKSRLDAIKAIEQAEQQAAREAQESARAAKQEWNQLWGGVEQTAKNAFIQFAAHGKSAMKSIGEAIKLSIIDMLYQITVRRWIINIGAQLESSFAGALTGGSGAGGGAMGSLFNGANLLNAGKTIFNGFSSGLTGTASSLVSGLGRTMGSSALSSFGAGLSGVGTAGASAGIFSAAGGAGTAFIGGAGTAIGGSGMGAAASMGASFAAMAGPAIALFAVDAIGRLFGGNKTLGGAEMIPVLGGFLAGLFGHGPMKFRQQVALGTASDEGFDGNVTDVYRAKGGLLVKNKHHEQAAGNESELIKLFDSTISGFANSAKQFADNLGLSKDAITGYSKEIRLESEKGKTLTEEAIQGMLASIGDDFARGLIPSINDLSRSGESAFATLTRLNAEFTALVDAGTLLGSSVANARAYVSGSTFEGRTAFVDAAGGIDALLSKAQYFSENFLTESERLAPKQERLNTELTKLGLSTDLTKDQFKGLVQSFGSVNGIIEDMLQSLLTLAPAFLEVRNATEAAAQAAQEAAAAEKDRTRALQMDALNTAFSGLQKSVDAQRKQLSDDYNHSLDAVNTRIQNVSDSVGKLKTLSDALKATVNSIQPLTRDQAKQQIKDAIDTARKGGKLPDADSLRNALGVLGDSKSITGARTPFEMAREQAKTAILLGQLGDMTDASLDKEQQSLNVLIAQRKALEDGFKRANARLDSLIEQGQKQIDAMSGIPAALTSLTAAIALFNNKILQMGGKESDLIKDPLTGGTPITGNPKITDKQIRDFVNTPGRTERQIYDAAKANGVSFVQYAAATGANLEALYAWADKNKLPRFASGGFHRGGLRLVGERGPELEFTGPSRIASNNDLTRMLRNDDVVKELRAIVIEIREVKKHSEQTANRLNAVTRGGTALRTKAA